MIIYKHQLKWIKIVNLNYNLNKNTNIDIGIIDSLTCSLRYRHQLSKNQYQLTTNYNKSERTMINASISLCETKGAAFLKRSMPFSFHLKYNAWIAADKVVFIRAVQLCVQHLWRKPLQKRLLLAENQFSIRLLLFLHYVLMPLDIMQLQFNCPNKKTVQLLIFCL